VTVTDEQILTGRIPRFFRWVREHTMKTFFLVLLLVLLAELSTIPWFGVSGLRTENPAETALMRQRRAEAEREGKSLKIVHRWIPLSRIPAHVINAVIVAEDGTFYAHGGFDWYEVQQSIEKNVEEQRAARGASTITQQLAKNLYLSTSKDPVRKAREVLITLLLEHYLEKGRILELYLNLIEWGRGIFGIEAAALTYFGKSASGLTIDEGARLAAVIPSPLRHRPDSDSRYTLRRKQIVLGRMSGRNFLSQSPAKEDSSSRPDQEHLQTMDATDSTAIDEGDSNGL
jgi:monofunctional biosynthetic peptidoglycan transglycosylase